MKKYHIILIICTYCLLLSCTGKSGIPAAYQPLINAQLEKAGDNRAELEKALHDAPNTQKEGMAFLIAYMPEADLTALTADYLLKNVSLTYKAREEFPWAKSIPDSLFLNDVLPYANAGETRDEWREDFYNRFSPYVKGCTTLEEAVRAINENAKAELGVEYNTARRRADQSPTESLEIMIASCTGLSIMLTDAFRAVGIPSRLAGTIWHDGRGNHTWSEVWIDGEWFFTEYYFEDLNSAWFLADAGKATPGGGQTSIIAASYKPSKRNYRQAWNRRAGETAGYDVSQRYIELYQTVMADKIAQGNHIPLRVKMYKNRKSTSKSDDRVKVMVDIFQGADQLGGGSTAGETQDMNDVLEFLVEKNKEYTLKYFPDGKEKIHTVSVKEEAVEVTLFAEE